MDFVLRQDARRWFSGIRDQLTAPAGPRSPDFDVFYFCFIAGVIGRRKESQPVGDAAVPLVENFPGPYRNNRGRLLVSVFLSYELEDFLGVKMGEKKAVHSAISDLVDPNAPNHLTDDGVREFNRYAAGGFEVLLDWFDDIRPTSLDSFLRRFKSELDSAMKQRTAQRV